MGAVSSPPPTDCSATGLPRQQPVGLHPNHNDVFLRPAISWRHRRQRVYNSNRKNRNDAVELKCATFTQNHE